MPTNGTAPVQADTPTWGQPNTPPITLDMAVSSYKRKMSPPKFGNKIYNIPLLKAFPHKLLDAKVDGEIGIEIECEGTHLFNAPIQWWQAKGDGSLRHVGDHPPVEYVLRKPISRDDVPKAMSYLTKKLAAAGSTIAESTRTSVHIHLNCQELTLKQIYCIWCLYTIFEELFLEFSGEDRKGNLFCLSGKQAEQSVVAMEQAIQTEDFSAIFDNNLRYTSCNMASLGRFGSMEFRSMRGTVDQDLIQMWIDILLIVKDKALTYDDPRGIVQDFLSDTPESFLSRVFSHRTDIYEILRQYPDLHQSMWDGLRLMRDVAYAVTWQKYDPEAEKKVEKKPLRDSSIEYAEEIVEGVWYTIENGVRLLTNYRASSVHDVPILNSHVGIAARRCYRLNNQGQYVETWRNLSNTDMPPNTQDTGIE